MKKRNIKFSLLLSSIFFTLILFNACKNDDDGDLPAASLPSDNEVFDDVLGSNITFDIFLGSDTTPGFISFEETSTAANSSSKAIKVEVPSSSSGYASGVFRSSFGRDLSSYNVLTFYAKASSSVNLNEVGFGIDFEGDPNKVNVQNLAISTTWKKYYIPIPNGAVLTTEKGLFYYSESEESAYTLYLDEIQFEDLGTIANVSAKINNGVIDTVNAILDETIMLNNFTVTINDPNATNVTATVSSSYFDFTSSNPDIATIDDNMITVIGNGMATITGSLMGTAATGAITVNSEEAFSTATPPNRLAESVVSLFSNVYRDVTVDTWRTDWSAANLIDLVFDGDEIKKYTDLSFVGIETTSGTVDASDMTHLHIDVYSNDFTEFRIKLVDFGPTGAYSGDGGDGQGDDSEHEVILSSPEQGTWISYDIALDDFVGLSNKDNLAQYILSAQPGGSATVSIDNMYFYKDENYVAPIATLPTDAPSTPSENVSNVISLFSDAYTDVSVDTWRTGWSAATLTDTSIASNAIKKYAGLNFAGIETTTNLIDASEMTHVHVDIWTADATDFRIKLVDFGPTGGYSGDGGDGQEDDSEHEITYSSLTQESWISYDIPLTSFTGLTNKSKIAQYVISSAPSGTATVFIDNLYFYAAP